MQSNPSNQQFASEETLSRRLLHFIEWAEPNGTAGINGIHANEYQREDPWFEWSTRFTNGGLARTPFIRSSYIGKGVRPLSREKKQERPKVLLPNTLITNGWFLSFAKAYVNILVDRKGISTPAMVVVMALSAFEEALRRANLLTKPTLEDVSARTFEAAVQIVSEFPLAQATLYEIGKELEILAGLLQGGYHSKSLRMDGAGFGLVSRPFTFTSTISYPPKKRDKLFEMEKGQRISTETVVAVGQAYRKSQVRFGATNIVSVMASMVAIPLTTTSMRLSDFLSLRHDSLFFDKDTNRVRIRIYRPKIKRYQSVPIPHKLKELAQELFAHGKTFGQSARAAFSFYINEFGEDFDSIDKLYIPETLVYFFSKDYFQRQDLLTETEKSTLMKFEALEQQPYLGTLQSLKRYRGVVTPGDVIGRKGEQGLFVRAKSLRHFMESLGVSVPKQVRLATAALFVNDRWLFAQKGWKTITQTNRDLIKDFFAVNGRPSCIFGSTKELKDLFLKSFKLLSFPHWPYSNSDLNLRLDEAFAVMESPLGNRHLGREEMNLCWWKPVLISGTYILSWIHPTGGKPPVLFSILDLRLADGNYPSFTFQDTRKLFQTTALLAGAEVAVLDELSGRTSGPQSAHYDKRTPREIALGSIELFDPEMDTPVFGPVMEVARTVPIVDRSAFLYQNSFPKQVTEVGGCSTSWSVNPCDKHGSCMRCEHSVWRKGDRARLPRIRFLHAHAERMIEEGRRLIAAGSFAGPIERHIRQHEDVRDRCAAIFIAEENSTIPAGALVTFPASETSQGAAELASLLHSEGRSNKEGGDPNGNAED